MKQKKRLRNIFSSFFIYLLFAFFLSHFRASLLHTDTLLNPTVGINKADVVMNDQVLPLLSLKKNNFHLSKPNPLIKQANAISYIPPVAAVGIVDMNSGDILYEKNFSKKLSIASLTKIMTAVVTLDLAGGDEQFVVSDYASHQIPTRIGVVPNERLSVKELLHALLLTSANDAATVLQEGVDNKYKASVFIKAMNAKADMLGLSNTSFANPQGFDDKDNYSSIEDLTILTQYALTNYPLIKDIVGKDYKFLPSDSNHKQFDLYNWNGLIGVYPATVGMKIGNTGKAGKTSIVVSNRGGKQIMAVVLGAKDIYERDLTASQLLDIGYQSELGLEPVNVTREQLRQKYLSWKY